MARIRSSLPPRTRAAIELELRRRRAEAPELTVPGFLELYYNDPARFVVDLVKFYATDGGPTGYQLETLDAFKYSPRVSVRGPHGLGKTALASWAILWFAVTRELSGEDWKIPTMASVWRQLTKYLWPEVRKWARRLRWNSIPIRAFNENTELLTLSLKLGQGEAFALTSTDPAAVEGAHATALFYVLDEAKAIPDPLWDAAEGAFASPEVGAAKALAISTPGPPVGRFYDIHARRPGLEDWRAIHVTLEQAIAANRISREWAEQRARLWGAGSATYKNRVLGEFASSSSDGVISLEALEASRNRWLAWRDAGAFVGRVDVLGVDVARGGGDYTVIAVKSGEIITELRRYDVADTMAVVGIVNGLLEKHPAAKARIDVIGVGAGVFDRLRELAGSGRVQAFNAAERTDWRDSSGELGFVNKRAAGWWNVRELLATGALALPDDDRLTGDLLAPTWGVQSGGVYVEKKDSIRSRIGRSPDDGDAVVIAAWAEPEYVYVG